MNAVRITSHHEAIILIRYKSDDIGSVIFANSFIDRKVRELLVNPSYKEVKYEGVGCGRADCRDTAIYLNSTDLNAVTNVAFRVASWVRIHEGIELIE